MFPEVDVEPSGLAIPCVGVEPNRDVDPIPDELGVPKREEEVLDPNAGVDDVKIDDVDPKAEGVGVPANFGADEDPKPVVPKPEGFEANGFDGTDAENEFADDCPNVKELRGFA